MGEQIDLMEELVNLYDQEEMLAFFDFHCAGAETLRGLCRISKPKSGAGLPYLSLTFIVDAATDVARAAADSRLAQLETDAFTTKVPSVAAVVSMPVGSNSVDHYIRQMDVMLQEPLASEHDFIQRGLLPAIRSLAQLEVSELVWWGDLAEPRSAQR